MMASSAAVSGFVVPDQQSTAGMALEDLTGEAKSLIAEAEQFIRDTEGALLPAGWAEQIRFMISEAETRVRRKQALHVSGSENGQTRDSWDSTKTWLRSMKHVSHSSSEVHIRGIALDDQRKKSTDSAILAELGNHHASIEEGFILSEPNPKLEALQEDVYALVSTISMQMADFHSLKQRKISELALFSIFEEEYGILMELNDQIEDLFQPSHGMGQGLGHGLLQLRFDALPLQLQAVFNIDCQERERKGGEIDDEEMMSLVLENQWRTEMLRSIQDVLDRKREAAREMGRK